MKLRLRTLLLSLTGLAIFAVTLGELMYLINERSYAAEARLAAETRRLMAAGAPLLLNALIVGDLATAEQTLRQLNADVVWRRVTLYEADGRRAMIDASPMGVPESAAPALIRDALRIDPPEQRLRIASDPVVYAVLGVTPASYRLENEVWAEISATLLMQVFLFAVLLLVMSVILARGLGPVHALADTAARFGAGDLTTRMRGTLFAEIAPTVRAFNTMAENLQNREAERREAERRQTARFAVTRILADGDEPDKALARVVEALAETLGWESGECWLVDVDGDRLRRACVWRAHRAGDAESESTEAVLARGAGLAGRAWDTGQAQRSTTGGAALAIPLRGARGVQGVIAFAGGSATIDDELLSALADVASRIGMFLERKEAEETLRRTEDQLRQAVKMEAVGKLAGGVAHDFNNLLTVILGRCEMLLMRAPADSPAHSGLSLIHRTTERAAALTRQLLAFSRRQVMQPQSLDLNTVVDGIMPMLRRLIGENVELATRLGPKLRRVRADQSQIEQVIVNLAVNARDAMPQGGRVTLATAEVVLDTAYTRRHEGAQVGPHIQLSVTDTGIGMDAATVLRIFEPFFTTKGPGRGTGLGLSTVYGIVRQSGGTIDVESEPDHGTTFRVNLPVETQTGSEDLVPPPPPVPPGWETILLVEDEADVRDLARDILRECGYTVLEAGDAQQAMSVASTHAGAIHLLLTDVVMPGASGRDLVTRISPLRPTMKIVYMSGYTDDAIVHHGVLDAGVTLIDKPFSPDDLARRIRSVLDDDALSS